MKIKTTLTTSILLYSVFALAQKGFISSGASATTSSGSVSYSIGQIDYIGNSQLSLGIQQVISLAPTYLLSGMEHISISAFPNPTSENLAISWDEKIVKTFKIEINTIDGKLVLSQFLEKPTILDFSTFSSGVYILNFFDLGNIKVKTVKIIHN
ncbi:MAG: T9SS C-terminal target domain-containing protein [Bacteroidetes bacterium]|nr:MAG: T9SS C-terminal target domain-containing protein [Bacteroidota bacterium]